MKLQINTLEDLDPAAKALINFMGDHKIIVFYGDMGAGKTTFIKRICSLLGVKDVVSSPTFSLVNEYITTHEETIYHFDFYRIKSLQEAFDIGYEEYFYSNSLCLVEWPEKITELLPDHHIKVDMQIVNSEQRIITAEKI